VNEKEFGKRVKLTDYTMEYGKKEKFTNILCFFKSPSDNNLYVIVVEDSNIPYGIIQYGSAHIKGNSLILIGSKNPNQEAVKELIYKIYNNEDLTNYEIKSLDEVEAIEIISPNKLEVKKEVVENIMERVMPKPKEEELKERPRKKKKSILPLLLILVVIGLVGYFMFFRNSNDDEEKIVKSIMCTKSYSSNELEALVIEDNTYNFNISDSLEFINKSTTYKFYEEAEYLDFINKGLYYSYIDLDNGGFTLDNDSYSLIVIEKEETETDYFLPTEYEEVLSYYKNQGYSCSEKVEE